MLPLSYRFTLILLLLVGLSLALPSEVVYKPVQPTVTSRPPKGTAGPTATRTATPFGPTPTRTPTPSGNNPLSCAVPNDAWTVTGQLLRGGAPGNAVACLAANGVDVLIDQRPANSDNESSLAAQAGIEYINLGITDDTAPSPTRLRQWIDTVNSRLAQGDVVLVHDTAGRGRMGFWDAVWFMQHGASAHDAIENRYLAKALPFQGAKIGCQDGGNGQVQALAEIGQILTGSAYTPSVDEYGTHWSGCARPGYMAGWNYGTVLP